MYIEPVIGSISRARRSSLVILKPFHKQRHCQGKQSRNQNIDLRSSVYLVDLTPKGRDSVGV